MVNRESASSWYEPPESDRLFSIESIEFYCFSNFKKYFSLDKPLVFSVGPIWDHFLHMLPTQQMSLFIQIRFFLELKKVPWIERINSGNESSDTIDLSSLTLSVNSSSCLAANWNSRKKGVSGTKCVLRLSSSSWFELVELAEVVEPWNTYF